MKIGCFDNYMPGIVGRNICIETTSSGSWDVVFTRFGGGGGNKGEFGYTRTLYSN